MPGPLPKDIATRQRRNKASTRATLTTDEQPRSRAPLLPRREDQGEWRDQTHVWWREIWRSPMASQWLDADIHGALYRLAMYVDAFWLAPDPRLEGAISSLEARLGLSPLDRRRLEWIVERVEAEKQAKPRARPTPGVVDDPRNLLRIVG